MIVAVDFDGFLFEDGWPYVGPPIPHNIALVRYLQDSGHRLILWTCREEEPLARAVEACRQYGITFVAVNDYDPKSDWTGPRSRKIYADIYLDDRAYNQKGGYYMEYGKFCGAEFRTDGVHLSVRKNELTPHMKKRWVTHGKMYKTDIFLVDCQLYDCTHDAVLIK